MRAALKVTFLFLAVMVTSQLSQAQTIERAPATEPGPLPGLFGPSPLA